MINTSIVIGCFLTSIFYSAVCESLRNFLRSRLAFVCRRQKNEQRFGVILKEDEIALQAAKAVRLTTLVVALLLGAIERYHGPAEFSTLTIWSDFLVVLACCWLSLLVFPWAISRVAAEHILFHTWPVISGTIRVMKPVIIVEKRIDTFVHRLAGRKDPTPENLETIREEIQTVVDEGERDGILESRAGKMIHRIMELRQEDVRAVMTPRTDIITIQDDSTLDEARTRFLEERHSRIPVVEGSTDQIVGILYARDLLEHIGKSKSDVSLRELVRKALYVPETNSIDGLLNRMKKERLHLAIVLDEYGGVTGLVTLEDILEEIVGEIEDEFDEEEDDRIEWLDPHTMVVDARLHIDEMNDLFDLELPEDRDFDTLGGLVFSELERVPKQGERFEWKQIQFTVIEATERQILRIQLYSPVTWPRHDQTSPLEKTKQQGEKSPFRLIREEPSPEEQAS